VTCGVCGDLTKRIFVTNTTTTGAIVYPTGCTVGSTCTATGVAAADAICASEATTYGLTGTYHAWLSTSTVNASAHTTQNAGGYILNDGTSVATSFNKLITSSSTPLLSAVKEEACGGEGAGGDGATACPTATAFTVWTGSAANGTVETGDTCSDWTSAAAATKGEDGVTSATGATWTTNAAVGCNTAAHIYCLEQ